MDPLEKTFGAEDRDIIYGFDRKYHPGDIVTICLKKAGPQGVLLEVSKGEVVSYEGKERYIPPGSVFYKIERNKTTKCILETSDKSIDHTYNVKLKNGKIQIFYQKALFPEHTSKEYVFRNAFLNR